MEPTAAFAQLQLDFVDQIQWRYEVIRPLVLLADRTATQRAQGVITSSHQELVQALQRDKGNISHSLQTLERHGLLIIGRSPGGHAESLLLTPAGHQRAAQLPGSCD